MSVYRAILLSACFLLLPAEGFCAESEHVDLSDAEAVGVHRPFLVAHRGGVVAPNAPECSLAAIHLAAEHGYRMVELDVQEAKDAEPVVFYDWSLVKGCGIDGTIETLLPARSARSPTEPATRTSRRWARHRGCALL